MRFVDLRAAYWSNPDGSEKGPFAFIDTITDTFVEIDSRQLFDDVDDFEDAVKCDIDWNKDVLERLRGLIPDEFK